MVLSNLNLITIDLIADTFSERAIEDYFKFKGIDFVRIQWVDYCNMIVLPSPYGSDN